MRSDVGIRSRSKRRNWVLRVLVGSGLAVDAFVHLRLASEYQLAFPEGVGGGTMFRIEAVLAALAAVAVLALGSRWSYVFAFLVAASALAAVVLSVYVELPALGPVPSMYEPVWFTEKSLSAVAEGVAAAAALAGVLLATRTLPTAGTKNASIPANP